MQEVYWDSYGLTNPFSGIYTHASHIYRELVVENCRPRILGNAHVAFAASKQSSVTDKSAPKLLNNKLLAPLRSQQELLSLLANGQAVVLHGLSNINLPLWRKNRAQIKTVITIHDVIPLLYPQAVSVFYRAQFKFLIRSVIRNADHIICVSNWTKRSLLSFFEINESKLSVVPNGFAPEHNSLKNGLNKNFSGDPIHALTISRYEKYKRLDLILEILKISKKKICFSVVTDAKGEKIFTAKARAHIDAGTLKIYRDLGHQELEKLYDQSHVYLQPSRCEGFCIPAADAQLHGIPVVYQTGTGVDEVVGVQTGKGLTAEVDATAWYEAILEMYDCVRSTTFGEQLRTHLKAKNTWKDSAKAVKLIYEQLLT